MEPMENKASQERVQLDRDTPPPWKRIFWVGPSGYYEPIGHIHIETGEITPPWFLVTESEVANG